jgi:hypothetical protein
MEINDNIKDNIKNNTDDFCIILTSTVNINPIKSHIHVTDPNERLKVYLKSIKHWLDESNFKIILVDNSGYTFPELNEYIDKYKERFEIISFIEDDIDNDIFIKAGAQAVKLKTDYLYTSKGTSEMFSIYYSYLKSKLIRTSKFVIKVTCRYFIKELELFLNNVNVDDYLALRQIDPDSCEVVGCHINVFIRASEGVRLSISHLVSSKDRRCPLWRDHTEVTPAEHAYNVAHADAQGTA